VQTDQRSINQKQLLRSQELVNAGTIPRETYYDATVASDNQRVIIAENTLMISKLSLAQLLQLDTFQDFDNTEVEEDNKILLQTPIAIYDKAKEQRTELKLAQINLEIAEKMAIAKGAFNQP
jgi:outer membrane protein